MVNAIFVLGHESSVDVARCHPNGNYVVTGSTDKTCRLWDINSGGCVRLFTGSKVSTVVCTNLATKK